MCVSDKRKKYLTRMPSEGATKESDANLCTTNKRTAIKRNIYQELMRNSRPVIFGF